METITIRVFQDDVYVEVAKATDYTGSKLPGGDDSTRDRILAADADLAELSRFWEESVSAVNENFKEMLVHGSTRQVSPLSVRLSMDAAGATDSAEPRTCYEAEFEVSVSFDKALAPSVQSTLRSFFIASIIGQWVKFANKDESNDYLTQAVEILETAERLLYSRRRPLLPTE